MKKTLLLTALLLSSTSTFASWDKHCVGIYTPKAEVAFNPTPITEYGSTSFNGVITSHGKSYRITTYNTKQPKGKIFLKDLPNNFEITVDILGIWGEFNEPGTLQSHISAPCICDKSKCYIHSVFEEE